MEETQTSVEIFDKLLTFPVISEAWNYFKAKYEEVKNIEYVGGAVKSAEEMFLNAAEKSKPLLHKVDKQISAVDDLAVKSLGKLEEKFPVTKKEPKEIKEVIALYFTNIGIKSVVLYGKYASSLMIDAFYIALDIVKKVITKELLLSVIKNIADFIVPPISGEAEESVEGKSFYEEFSSLLAKLQTRIQFYGRILLEGKAKEAGIDWKDFPLLVLLMKFLALYRVVYYEVILIVLTGLK